MIPETCWMPWQDGWGFLVAYAATTRQRVIRDLEANHGEPWANLRRRIKIVKVTVRPVKKAGTK